MAATSSPTASLQVKRTFAAKREKVFKAWTDAKELKSWFLHPGYETPDVEVDLRVGGAYKITIRKLPDGDPFNVSGQYKEVTSFERLVFSWAWSNLPDVPETIVTVEFRDLGESTEIVLSHDLFRTEEIKNDHLKGWGICLDSLEKYLA